MLSICGSCNDKFVITKHCVFSGRVPKKRKKKKRGERPKNPFIIASAVVTSVDKAII